MQNNKSLYLESLLPKEPHLSKTKRVNVIISPTKDDHEGNFRLDYENPVNAHLFKPIYFEDGANSLVCYCATITVAQHVKMAWEIYSGIYKLCCASVEIIEKASNGLLTEKVYYEHIKNMFVNHLIHKNIIIGRIDSINAFPKMLFIKEGLKVGQLKLERLFIELELHRLNNHLITVHNANIFEKHLDKISIEKIDTALLLSTTWVGKYLAIENIEFKGKKITIINLPWGQDLAYSITKQLLQKNNHVKKIAVVGGIGSLSEDKNIAIDDIFMANSTRDEKNNQIDFKNEFGTVFKKNNKEYISPSEMFIKNVISGRLLCVDSSLGHQKDFSRSAKKSGIDAFDMESYGVMKAVKETKSKVKIYMLHYIMDLPLKGLGLSATYYNKEFLNTLLSSFNRGKYFCFDYILEHI